MNRRPAKQRVQISYGTGISAHEPVVPQLVNLAAFGDRLVGRFRHGVRVGLAFLNLQIEDAYVQVLEAKSLEQIRELDLEFLEQRPQAVRELPSQEGTVRSYVRHLLLGLRPIHEPHRPARAVRLDVAVAHRARGIG
jgi:hypothetical protein